MRRLASHPAEGAEGHRTAAACFTGGESPARPPVYIAAHLIHPAMTVLSRRVDQRSASSIEQTEPMAHLGHRSPERGGRGPLLSAAVILSLPCDGAASARNTTARRHGVGTQPRTRPTDVHARPGSAGKRITRSTQPRRSRTRCLPHREGALCSDRRVTSLST